jgi:hypothetical protein
MAVTGRWFGMGCGGRARRSSLCAGTRLFPSNPWSPVIAITTTEHNEAISETLSLRPPRLAGHTMRPNNDWRPNCQRMVRKSRQSHIRYAIFTIRHMTGRPRL